GQWAVKCSPKESAYVSLLDSGVDVGDAGGGDGSWLVASLPQHVAGNGRCEEMANQRGRFGVHSVGRGMGHYMEPRDRYCFCFEKRRPVVRNFNYSFRARL